MVKRYPGKSLLVFGLAAFVVGFASLVSYRATTLNSETGQMVIHTQEVLRAIQTVLVSIEDAESEARGYALSGQDVFVEGYQQSVTDAREHVLRLLSRQSRRPQPGRRR